LRSAKFNYDERKETFFAEQTFSEQTLMLRGISRLQSVGFFALAVGCTTWHAIEHFFEPWLTLAGM
jgi:hypothetical protein